MRKSAAKKWLSLAGLLGLGMVGGCGGSTSVGTFNGAVEGTPCSPVGGMSPSSDGCNTCTCGSNGSWGCTKKACGGAGGSSMGAGGSSTGAGGSSATCKDGDTMMAGDGCNTCGCSNGQWACTLIACVACVPGQMKTADDGCNTCTCGSMGDWACTEKACIACIPGEMKQAPDGCNTCTCSDTGTWGCTKRACIPPVECTQGQTKTIDCNTCGCTADGHWVCTARACQPTMCPAPVPSMEVCDTVIAWAKDPAGGTCCMYGTACVAPAGWNKFNSQQECAAYTCPPPANPGPNVGCVAVIAYGKDPKTGHCCQYSDPCHVPAGMKVFTNDVECQKAPIIQPL